MFKKFKPELTTLEACHRLAAIEGEKENKIKERGRRREMKDKTIIVPVLVLYIGLWVFTGTATSAAIATLEKVNASISMLSTPLGIFLLLAGIVILTYVCARNSEKGRMKRNVGKRTDNV